MYTFDTPTPYEMVRAEFHPAFWVRQNIDPAGGFASVEEKRLRFKLITEEFLEVARAFGVDVVDLNEILYRLEIEGAAAANEALELAIEDRETDLVALTKELRDLVYVVDGTNAILGIDGDRASLAVHKSNMSKAVRVPSGDPAVRDTFEVIRRADGKVLKGPDYRPAEPAIKQLIFPEAT